MTALLLQDLAIPGEEPQEVQQHDRYCCLGNLPLDQEAGASLQPAGAAASHQHPLLQAGDGELGGERGGARELEVWS